MARHVEAEPGCAEQDQDRNDGNEQVGPRLDRVPHLFDLTVLSELAADTLHFGQE